MVVLTSEVEVVGKVVVAPPRKTSPTEVFAAGGVDPLSTVDIGWPRASSSAVTIPSVRPSTSSMTARIGHRPLPCFAAPTLGAVVEIAGPNELHGETSGARGGGSIWRPLTISDIN